jgi:DNA-binding NarL/FixJ family response regulator
VIYLPGDGKNQIQSDGLEPALSAAPAAAERKLEGTSPMGIYSNSGMATDSQVKLTKREVEVLSLVIEGKSSKEVADQLYVSKRTVDFHLANIYSKLSVTNRLQAFREATRRGLLSYPGSGNPQ